MTHRTWVRIPGPPQMHIIVFLQVIPCKAMCVVHHASSPNHLPDSPRPDLVVQNESLPYALVNMHTWNQESKYRPACIGPPKLLINPLIRPKTPLSISISFFLFYLFICLINYFYYLTNQLNFFSS